MFLNNFSMLRVLLFNFFQFFLNLLHPLTMRPFDWSFDTLCTFNSSIVTFSSLFSSVIICKLTLNKITQIYESFCPVLVLFLLHRYYSLIAYANFRFFLKTFGMMTLLWFISLNTKLSLWFLSSMACSDISITNIRFNIAWLCFEYLRLSGQPIINTDTIKNKTWLLLMLPVFYSFVYFELLHWPFVQNFFQFLLCNACLFNLCVKFTNISKN